MSTPRSSTVSFADAVRAQSKAGGNSYSVTTNPDGTQTITRTSPSGISTVVAKVLYQGGGEVHTDANSIGDQVIVYDLDSGYPAGPADATIFLNSLT